MKKNTTMQKKIIITTSIMMIAAIAFIGSGRAFAQDNQDENKSSNDSAGSYAQDMMGGASQQHEGEGQQNSIAQMAKGFDEMMKPVTDMSPQSTKPSLAVVPSGEFRATGATVTAIDATGDTVSISLFGLARIVSVNGATFTAGGNAVTLTDIKVGDNVAMMGTINAATGAVTATRVNDATVSSQKTSNIQSQIQQLMQLVQQLQAQLQALGGSH